MCCHAAALHRLPGQHSLPPMQCTRRINIICVGARFIAPINAKLYSFALMGAINRAPTQMTIEVIMPFEQPQSIRTIFFDAGFTLLRPNPSTPEICQQVCQRLDLRIHLDAVKERMKEAQDYYLRHMRLHRHTWCNEQTIAEFWTGYYMNLLRPFIEEHDEPRLYRLAQSINEEFDKHTSWRLYPDVLPTLDALRSSGKYTLGVISDWGIGLGPILRRLNLTSYFDCLLISAVTRHAKPSPMLYELALQRANSIADYSL